MAKTTKTAETEDPRLTAVQNNQQQAMQDIENTYGGMAEGVQQNLQKQQAMTQDWANKQTELQQQQTDFTIEQIEQQKEQTQKDLAKEQGAAYTDYQKQTAKHGVNAEQMAAQGMTGTGYSESSRVAMYTAYQNRVAVARESAEKAMVSFNNAITQARMQNSSVLAQIAFDGLKTQLELGLQGMQYENQILTEMLGLKLNTKNMYHGQYMDILNQINQEKAFNESVRQHEQSMAYQKEQDKQAQDNWQKQYDLSIQEQDRQEKLDAAELMASGGDFSGYKDLFGLTNAQVKKLEAAYSKDSGGLIIDPAGDPGGTSLPAQGNANTKAAKLAILDEKDFKKYQGSGRVKVNGKNYTNYQAYAMARIEDIANNGLNGKQLTDEEIEWLLAEYGLLK